MCKRSPIAIIHTQLLVFKICSIQSRQRNGSMTTERTLKNLIRKNIQKVHKKQNLPSLTVQELDVAVEYCLQMRQELTHDSPETLKKFLGWVSK